MLFSLRACKTNSAESSQQLVHALVHSCLAASSPARPAQAAELLARSSDAQWRWALSQLSLHRLVEHVFCSLKVGGLTSAVPEQYRRAMAAQYLRSVQNSRVLLSALDALLEASSCSGLRPVVLKGIALAEYFYPDPATRPMGDLDLAFTAAEMKRVPEAFAKAGFEPCLDKPGGDAMYFANATGVQCDAHFRQRLFEGKTSPSMDLTTEVSSRNLRCRRMRVYGPNAMVAHLVVHMDGHWAATGPLLCWIIDIALVLRKWGGLIEQPRLEELMPELRHLILLGRLLAFLRDEFGERPPESLAGLAAAYEGFTLAQLLRRHRLKAWGLPGVRGWGRVLARRFGVPLKWSYPGLSPGDLIFWTTDAVADWRAVRFRNESQRRTYDVTN